MEDDEMPFRGPHVTGRPTRKLETAEIGGWPLVNAALERLGPWARHALRLGTLTKLQHVLRMMAYPDARAELVDEARALVEALAHMQWEE